MGKGLTDAQLAQIANSTATTRILITIELDNPIRILQNDSVGSLIIDDKTYYTKLIQMGDIQASIDGNSESVDIIISDISQEFATLIADNGDVLTNITCKIERAIFNGEISTIVGSPISLFKGKINKVQLAQNYFAFTVERELYSYSTVSPNKTYDINCQYEFKCTKCAYTGSETKCDKTLTRCQELVNVENFGGYPSIILPVSVS